MLRANLPGKNWRQLVMVVVLSATTTLAFSQSYSHAPNDTLMINTVVNNSVTMNITQVHPNNDTLQFFWKKLSVSLPNEWAATICDNFMCYPYLVDSSVTAPVLPGDDGLMLIHCSPNTNPGTGIIRYTIYEVHSPLQVDTLTWIIHASATAGLGESNSSAPAYILNGNQLLLTDNGIMYNHFTLLDLNGKAVFSSDISATAPVKIPNIPASFYYLVLSGSNTIIRQKIWYSIN